MLKLIPQPKKCIQTEGVLEATSVCYTTDGLEPRLRKALTTLPFDENGAKLTVTVGKDESESWIRFLILDSAPFGNASRSTTD